MSIASSITEKKKEGRKNSNTPITSSQSRRQPNPTTQNFPLDIAHPRYRHVSLVLANVGFDHKTLKARKEGIGSIRALIYGAVKGERAETEEGRTKQW